MLMVLRADPLEDAARALAKKIGVHVSTADTVRLSERNISSLPAASASRARQIVERSLRRGPRNGTPVDVLLTLSQNPAEAVLVAEIVKGDERWVESATFSTRADIVSARTLPALERRVVWEQGPQMLDVLEMDGTMLVLDTKELTIYENRQRIRSFASPLISRDPVARLSAQGDTVIIASPERECRGTWRPELKLECTPSGDSVNLWQVQALPPHYSMARTGGLTILAEPDGRVHLYNDTKPLSSWTGWGGEITTVCNTQILASSDRERERGDVLQMFELAEAKPVAASSPLELPGPVMALHPRQNGALAIIRDVTTSNYAAYHITVDCTR